MIDKKHIGKKLYEFETSAEKGQLRFFAKATGQTDPIYFDEAAARAAGHPGLPLPPTFLSALVLLNNASTSWREEIGIKLERVLHGEQSFTYHRMAYAGEPLQFEAKITDIYDKRGGALDFVVNETRVTNGRGEHVADLRSVLVHRNT
ncbi:MAG: MaoC family dehydratase N-terminal domain-containing protein [Hyphomicrobiales bacterium]|nr:MaoC family dehydratase N-terminal domain-containing protein [Hyphomicrobiales bacterium]